MDVRHYLFYKLGASVLSLLIMMGGLAGCAGSLQPVQTPVEVTPPPAINSRSLIPIIKGEKYFRKYLFGKNDQDEYVRDGKWKLINKPRGYYELYDLDNDRKELKNVANKYPQTVAELKARLLEHKIQMSRYND